MGDEPIGPSSRLIGFDVPLDGAGAIVQGRRMPTWSEFEAAAPMLAQEVRERLEAHTHKTIATLRADGSPRISGTESTFRDGDLWIGSMWQARKARDLQRDPRFALHSGSDEPSDWQGDAKLAGIAEEVTDREDLDGESASSRRSPNRSACARSTAASTAPRTCSGSTCARSPRSA